jgi:hypothetical protein
MLSLKIIRIVLHDRLLEKERLARFLPPFFEDMQVGVGPPPFSYLFHTSLRFVKSVGKI